jgi:hypothetical protein
MAPKKNNTHNINKYIHRSTIAEAGNEVKNGVGTARTSSTAWLTKVQGLAKKQKKYKVLKVKNKTEQVLPRGLQRYKVLQKNRKSTKS